MITKITKEQLGDKYPFNASPVYLKKDSIGGLYVFYKNTRFNLNGAARKGFSLDSIWLDNPEIPGTKKSLGVVFDVCREKGLM